MEFFIVLFIFIGIPAFFVWSAGSIGWHQGRGTCQGCKRQLPTMQGRTVDRCPSCGTHQVKL